MALIQIGFLGDGNLPGTGGPVFVDDTAVGSGKYLLLTGEKQGGSTYKLIAKQPAFATALGLPAPYTSENISLGNYADNQTIGGVTDYYQPASGLAFSSYQPKGADWVKAAAQRAQRSPAEQHDNHNNRGTTTTGGGTTTTTTTGTTSFATDAVNTVETFISKYWWAVLLVLIALLWKPVIAPALGMGPKRRRR